MEDLIVGGDQIYTSSRIVGAINGRSYRISEQALEAASKQYAIVVGLIEELEEQNRTGEGARGPLSSSSFSAQR